MSSEPVVITGVGIVSAVGIGASEFFESVLQKRSGIRSLAERTDGDATPNDSEAIDGVWIGAPITDFQAKQYVKPRKALKVMCREIQTAFASAHLAMEHAGLPDCIPATDDGSVSPSRLGVVYGSEIFFNPPDELAGAIHGCIDDSGKLHPGRFGDVARKEVMPLWMLKYLPNMPACQVGISLNSQGPNNSLVLGDVSGPAALIEASSYLNRDVADVVVVGATGTRVGATRMVYHRDSPAPQLGDHALEDASRPHDPEAPGVIGGEGAASVILETQSNALNRNAAVLAKVLASASRFSPSKAIRSPQRSATPNPAASRDASDAISLAIQAVLEAAKLSPQQIGLVVSHATGDQQADAGEAAALAKCSLECPLIAVGALIGHTGAASGMIEVCLGALALASKTIPPSRHVDGINDTVRVCDTAQPLESPYVLCVSYTTEGSATAILLGDS